MLTDAIYTGLAGMQAYSQGLEVISNNVANLNTTGFKTATPNFEDLVFQNTGGALSGDPADGQSGAGVEVTTTTDSFAQGQLSASSDPLDAAISGNGFFVLNNSGTTLYTRAGQFEIDKNGFLVDATTQAQVMFSTDKVPVGSLNVNAFQTDAPVATTTVTLAGNLVQGDTATTTGTTPVPTTYQTPAITVFDASGATETITVKFTEDSTNPLLWTAEVEDANGAVIGSQKVTFNADGTLAADTSITATVTPTSAPKFDIKVNLGSAKTYAGVTDLGSAGTSSIQAQHVDGQAIGALTAYSFTSQGQLKATYSNGDTKTLGTLVLAKFQTDKQLKEVGNGDFASVSGSPILGTALGQGLGSVEGGQIEMSNVDLTNQFTDLIIIQRGYQAGSQMVSTANDMIQQLLNMGHGQ
jgi:flagellar hook protein FlgE